MSMPNGGYTCAGVGGAGVEQASFAPAAMGADSITLTLRVPRSLTRYHAGNNLVGRRCS
jgi:hypothetical protein